MNQQYIQDGRLADLRTRQATVQDNMSSIDQETMGLQAQNMILESEIEKLKRHTPSRTQDLLTQEDRINEKQWTFDRGQWVREAFKKK